MSETRQVAWGNGVRTKLYSKTFTITKPENFVQPQVILHVASLNLWNRHMISEESIFAYTGKWTSTMALYSGTKQSTVHMAYSTFSHQMQLLYSLQTKAYIFYRKFVCFFHITKQPIGKVVHSTLNYSELSYYHFDFIIMVVPKVDHHVYEMYTCYIWMISLILYHAFSKKSATVFLPYFRTEPPKVIIIIIIIQILMMMMMPNATLLSFSHRLTDTKPQITIYTNYTERSNLKTQLRELILSAYHRVTNFNKANHGFIYSASCSLDKTHIIRFISVKKN